MKTLTILFFVFGSVLLFGFSNNSKSVQSIPNAENIQPSDSLSLLNGSLLFRGNCHGCHATYISHAYDKEGWNTILDRMTINAGIDSIQRIDLSNYIFDELSKTDSSNVLRTVGGYRQW